MKRIGVVGSCQVIGVADALFHLLEGYEISSFFLGEFHKTEIPQIGGDLAGCDIVIAQDINGDRYGPLATKNLRKEIKNLIVFPVLAFTGLHPDCAHLLMGRDIYCSPLDAYHSAIVAASYSLELSIDRTARLFNKLVFKRLGYLDEFAKARAFLQKTMNDYGLDIAGEWPGWMASGAFMHTFNHPKPAVLASVAKLIAVKAGLIPAQTPTPDLSYDYLSAASITFPVYPELVEPLGIKGDYVFRKRGLPDLTTGDRKLLSLRDFIQGSYDCYADVPLEAFNAPQISKVRATLSSVLRGE